MKVEFDFSTGDIKGYFVVYTKWGRYYGTHIWVTPNKVLRLYSYFFEPKKSKAYKVSGECRILLQDVQKVVIKAEKF